MLKSWPEQKEGPVSSSTLSSQQYEMADAYEAMEFYFHQGWTDGLPVVPPTEERVLAFLEHVGRHPSDVLGTVSVRNRVVTVEKVAINAVMAGCKPEYMPVVVAAVEALLDDTYNLHGTTNSTGSSAPLLLINGPVRHRLGFNSGSNLFGPGNRANATVGRAMRLFLLNVCGAIPGVLDRSTMGHPGQYTYCIAENEEINPWEPLHMTRGFAREESTVTALPALAPWQLTHRHSERPEDILITYADVILAAGPRQVEILVVISPEFLGHIKKAGWSRRRVQEFLFQTARRTVGQWAQAGRIEPSEAVGLDGEKVIPACRDSEEILIVTAGGEGGTWGVVVPLWNGGVTARAVTCRIDTSRL